MLQNTREQTKTLRFASSSFSRRLRKMDAGIKTAKNRTA
jgi:hypothetical protein